MRIFPAIIGQATGSLAPRLRFTLEWYVDRPIRNRVARIYRPRLNGVTFIGVTGSAGKTSTTSMIAAILKTAGSVKSSGSGNQLHNIAQAVMATRPSDDFYVMELGAGRRGAFGPMVRLLAPSIGVVTTVGEDHFKAFGSREAIAVEKGKLIAALPPEGTAVLNIDDPLVWAMREGCKGRLISFGLSDGADLQARDIHAAWPERLSFTVRYKSEDHRVQTQLCGRHWVTATLAALAAGLAAGVPLAEAVKAVAQVPPRPARMEPVTTPDGITFLRDEWKAQLWAMPTIFDFLRDAKASRKVVVIGTLSDYHGERRTKYNAIGQEALKVADVVMFVGSMATHGLRAQRFAAKGQTLTAFPNARQASDALQDMLRPGDLVVLKGSGTGDHLGRLYHARIGPVACWRMDCGKATLCEGCLELRPKQSEPSAALAGVRPQEVEAEAMPVSAGETAPSQRPGQKPVQVFIGIGNPGEKYRDTPHNVGFAVLDILAERHGLSWESCGEAEIARLARPEGDILLVKPQKNVNNTGKVVLALSKSMGFTEERCILAYDDVHLPIGRIRTRMRGSDGGHLGVRSMLVAFQTGDIRRVKVGVGSADNSVPSRQYLLSPFPAAVAVEVKVACATAVDRLLEMASERKLTDCDAL